MSEKPFDFFANWGEAENRRFLEALKQKKTKFCEEHGLPVPAFDKEEDFFVTPDMLAWAQGSEGRLMEKCAGRWKYEDCASGRGLTWPCGAYVPTSVTRFDRIRSCKTPEEMAVELNANGRRFCPKEYSRKKADCTIPCGECITAWLQEEAGTQ